MSSGGLERAQTIETEMCNHVFKNVNIKDHALRGRRIEIPKPQCIHVQLGSEFIRLSFDWICCLFDFHVVVPLLRERERERERER